MHSFRELIKHHCDRLGWEQADLARASKLSPQLVNRLWNDDRDQLNEMPKRATMTALAAAFHLDEDVVLLTAARAYGVPVDKPATVADASRVGDEELVAEVLRRLKGQSALAATSTGDVHASPAVEKSDDLALRRRARPAQIDDDDDLRPGELGPGVAARRGEVEPGDQE